MYFSAIRFSQRLAKTNAFKELKPEVKVHGCTDRVRQLYYGVTEGFLIDQECARRKSIVVY